MDYALTTSAVELFVDTLNYQNGLMYLGEQICSPLWVKMLIVAAMVAIAGCFAVKVVKSRFFRNSPRFMKALIVWGIMSTTLYAGWKSIIDKSAADSGTSLAEVYAGPTNGMSRVHVKAYGGKPEPMWYRNTKDQTWIKAVDDGWMLDYALDDGNLHERQWMHTSTNDAVTAWHMWYFGENPPAVEIVEQGGVVITGFAVSGRSVKVTWEIKNHVELLGGSVVTVEYATVKDGNDVWTTVFTDNAPVHGERSMLSTGFYLDRITKWRVRLEVPE